MYRFEKLRVYQESIELVKEIYKFCQKLPKSERFALADQLKRSSISIILNIAEGTGSLGDKEFKKFLRNSLKSLYETVAGIKIAENLFNVNGKTNLEKCDIIGKQLNCLIKSLAKD